MAASLAVIDRSFRKGVTMHSDIINAVMPSRLHLIINPTEQCNLRCSYCYESFALKKMPLHIRSGVIQFVKRRAQIGLALLEVEFFGGEPLGAWDVVSDFAIAFDDQCRETETRFVGRMTTNGTMLTKPRLDFLAARSISGFQVTLDGPPTIHNDRRKSITGLGSFDAVWRCLMLMKESPHELAITLRMHHDPRTIDLLADGYMQHVVDSLVRGDPRFQLHFHALQRWGGPNDGTTVTYHDRKAALGAQQRLIDAAMKAGALPSQVPQAALSEHAGEAGLSICYAAQANAFVLRSDGRIGKCTVALNDDRNTVGRLTENGDMIVDHERHLPWLKGLLSGDRKELGCPAKHAIWNRAEGASQPGLQPHIEGALAEGT